MQDPSGHRVGDKVRLRAAPLSGFRATIQEIRDDLVEVETEDGRRSYVSPRELTNYSLAARRAWARMPKRVGRPPADPAHRKKMVSLRLDVDVWRRLGQAAEFGLIASREQAANEWLRQKLDDLLPQLAPIVETAAGNAAKEHEQNGETDRR